MSGEVVLAEAVDAYRSALADRLVAAYALGSLAHGGFAPLVSDVDLALLLSDPMQADDGEQIEAIAGAERAKGSALHDRLSVFWGSQETLTGATPGGRFPALDRLDLIEHGRLLAGTDVVRPLLPRPTRDELVLEGARFAVGRLGDDDAVRQIRSPEWLAGRGARTITKLVLFPVRFMFTAATGQVGTNHAAAAHYGATGGTSGGLVAAAIGWRTAPPADEAGVAELLRAELVPLYLELIDDHVPRLAGLGETELADAFTRWRRQLTRP